MVAQARMVSSFTDDPDIMAWANEIKDIGWKAAERLGADKRIFIVKTIERYKHILEFGY